MRIVFKVTEIENPDLVHEVKIDDVGEGDRYLIIGFLYELLTRVLNLRKKKIIQDPIKDKKPKGHRSDA